MSAKKKAATTRTTAPPATKHPAADHTDTNLRALTRPATTILRVLASCAVVLLSLSACAPSPGSQATNSAPTQTRTTAAHPATPEASPTPPDASTSAPDGGPNTGILAAGRTQNPAAQPAPSQNLGTPLRIRIRHLGVDAPLEQLSRNGAGELQPPQAWQSAGWYTDSPIPGQRGPAVIAGHSVAPNGPAVFVDLGKLIPGDEVGVLDSGQHWISFTVDKVIDSLRSDSFPSSEIYGPTPDAQLRLITCDGHYDPALGHWTKNIIVFATRTKS